MKLFGDNTDITEGIDSNIWRAIDKAISKNSIESFSVLKSFVRHVLQMSVRNNSIKHFQKYISFPAYYYSMSYGKAKRNPGFSEIHKFCSEEAARHLKETIWFDINFAFRTKRSFVDRKNANIFYYWAFYGFSRLFYLIVKDGEINQFSFAINEFEQISEENDNNQYQLKWEIGDLIKQNLNSQNDEIIKAKKDELKLLKQFDNYKRHVLLGIRYWVFFLYRVEKIDENTALMFLERIQVPYTDTEDLLNDILFFRGQHRSYMGWGEWDYLERQSGKVYSPPQPNQWMTSGFFADQIREKRFFVNLSELDSEDISQARFLLDDLKQYSKYFEENFERWKNILSVDNIGTFKAKSAEILEDFAMVKRKSVTNSDREIALAPLYQPYVENFRRKIGNAWKSQARIHRTFKHFGNAINVNDQEIKLQQIGQSLFFEKAKMMFTEESHQQIYGEDRMGGEIGRWEDNYFLSVIRQSDHNTVSSSSILDALNKSIYELKTKETVPNFILISSKYTYRDEKFLKSELFKSKVNNPIPENDLKSFCIGTFDGIPVYNSFSESLNNFILVCNLGEAFQQLYKTNDDWFENELTVDVQLVSDEIARSRLAENYTKWTTLEEGGTLTEEEALLLIKTSIIVDIWTTVDYRILNKDAYILGYIKTDRQE
ncbi:MAG TPA: hypothetical protein VF691_06090 [Cytophagaceae bacterium]|jgi:hypothetical protein